MQIDESRKLLLSDTLVPDIFITEYLPAMSGLAVKIYVYLLLSARSQQAVAAKDLARRMGVDEETIKATLVELASWKLIETAEDRIVVEDIKAQEIERIYRPKTASEPDEALQQQGKFSLREKMMADISKTFFQGLMSPSWYGEIDSWFDRFGFEAEVVYTLFQECARRNKLDSKAYITRVAENWAKRGIITYQDLNDYFLAHDKIRQVSRLISRKLRKNVSEYEEELISRWVEKLQFTPEVIEHALKKTVNVPNPSLKYVNAILENWFARKLKTVDDVEAYEKNQGKDAARKSRGSAGNVGNFRQREYSDDALRSLYERIETADEAPEPDDPGQSEEQLQSETQSGKAKALPGQMNLADLMDRSQPSRSKEADS